MAYGALGPQPHQIGNPAYFRGAPTLSVRLGTYGSGSWTFVAPADGDYLFVVQGASGAGFTETSTSFRGSGGGGYGYSEKIEKLTKGQSVPMTIGTGGARINADVAVAGQTTTVTLPSGTITVTAGGNGTGAISAALFNGGAGGVATGGSLNFAGGAGGAVDGSNGSASPGSAGGGPGGGAGGAGSSGDSNGNALGGGGGGAGTLLVPGAPGGPARKSGPAIITTAAGSGGTIINNGNPIASVASPGRVSISWLG